MAPATPIFSSKSDGFGLTVTVGDFDGDGFRDLAVAQPTLDPDADFTREGSLWVYYGRGADATVPDLELGSAGTFEYGLIDGLGYNPLAAH